MVGRPLTRIHETVQALVHAVQDGRSAEAAALQTRLNDLCVKHGVPRPEMPEQVLELTASWWGSRAMKIEELPAEPSTELDLDTRLVLVRAGQLGARRLLALVQDDSAFGPGGWLSQKAQLDVMGVAMQRGFGTMVTVRDTSGCPMGRSTTSSAPTSTTSRSGSRPSG